MPKLTSDNWQRVPVLISRLYEITDELERMFGRKFTPDGHLVGSLGEAIAVYMYDLKLDIASSKIHDGEAPDGRKVQVKLTGGNKSFQIYGKPNYLIALQLVNRNQIVEVFNGPGEVAWACAGNQQKNGQSSMAISRLRVLNDQITIADRIPRLRELHLSQ